MPVVSILFIPTLLAFLLINNWNSNKTLRDFSYSGWHSLQQLNIVAWQQSLVFAWEWNLWEACHNVTRYLLTVFSALLSISVAEADHNLWLAVLFKFLWMLQGHTTSPDNMNSHSWTLIWSCILRYASFFMKLGWG